MKRAFGILFISFFFIYIAEIPIETILKRPLPGGCCCKAVSLCHCQHANKLCHLKKGPQPEFGKGHKVQNYDFPVLSALNCGFSGEKTISPSYSKEFCLVPSANYLIPGNWNFLYLGKVENHYLFLDRRLDKPPKIPSFSYNL